MFLAEAPVERIMQGSDWPFYPRAISIAKALIATEGMPTERRLILHDNAARLYGLETARAQQQPERASAGNGNGSKIVHPSTRTAAGNGVIRGLYCTPRRPSPPPNER